MHSVKAQAGLRKRSSRKYTINGRPDGPNTPKRPRCMKGTSLHVIPAKLASRRVLSAAELTAMPRLCEPIYLVEIQAPEQVRTLCSLSLFLSLCPPLLCLPLSLSLCVL